MLTHILYSKKMKYYLIVLGILWVGALGQAFITQTDAFDARSINALVTDRPVVLLEDTYEGRLKLDEKKQITRTMLKRFSVQSVKSIETEALFTVYAYTDLIEEQIIADNQKINLNLLFTYNEGTDETILIIATPLYNEDY